MNVSRSLHAIAWAGRTLGRVLIGATTGLVVVSLVLVIASERFRFLSFREPISSDRTFQGIIGLGAIAFALLAAVGGRVEIGGRAGSAIKGALAGIAVGVIAGFVFGYLIGSVPGGGIPQKAAIALGIFLGGPLGAVVGGIVGAGAAGHAWTATGTNRSTSQAVAGSSGAPHRAG